MNEFNIPQKFRARKFSNFVPKDEQQRIALGDAQYFVECIHDRYIEPTRPIESHPQDLGLIGRGQLFHGTPGSGKTTLAMSTLLEIYYTHSIRIFAISMAEWIKKKTDQMSLADRKSEQAEQAWWRIYNQLEAVLACPVLLVDDIGKEYKTSSGYAEAEIDNLLRIRNTQARPTILTSNLPVEAWAKTYGDSMGSFVHEAFDVIPMSGKDQRRG
jgi:DNA replication protein DnaC